MTVIVTVFNPDGSQIVHPASKKPFVYERRDEDRAFLSALKAWLPWGKAAIRWKRTNKPPPLPPLGALMKLDDQPWKRFEEVPVYDENGVMVDTRMEWVDIAERTAVDDRRKRVLAMAERLGQKPPEWALADKAGPWEEEAASLEMQRRADAELEAKLDAADVELGNVKRGKK